MNELIKLIKEWIDQKKTGSITVNFFKGGLASVKKEEVLKISKKA